MDYVKDVDIYVGYRSDHSFIGLELELKNKQKLGEIFFGNLIPHY